MMRWNVWETPPARLVAWLQNTRNYSKRSEQPPKMVGWSIGCSPIPDQWWIFGRLNFKQSVAFGIIWHHIINVKVHGQNNVQRLLLNISGAAGTSNSFFLNTMKIFAKEELGRDGIVRAATPPDTAAYLINGNSLHSLLYLPVDMSKCLPLHCGRLKGINGTFSSIRTLKRRAWSVRKYLP